MLVDDVTITVKAGDGGNGAATLLRDAKGSKGGPNGGNGGDGGSVFVQGSSNIVDLREFRYQKKVKAENGENGGGGNKFGKKAPDTLILVPLGTRITDTIQGGFLEISEVNAPRLLVKGGMGGKGNVAFKSSTNRTPRYAQKGEKGEERILRFELRFIAEIGLVGFPNAGKSSLLAALTHATPAIGDYPFTTIQPNIGMLGSHPLADIPGLIEGASIGKGLGIKFLKHIEKTKMLIHCIDASLPNPMETYTIVRDEFAAYSKNLFDKPEIIFLNKTDLITPKREKELMKQFKKTEKVVISGATNNTESMKKFAIYLLKLLEKS